MLRVNKAPPLQSRWDSAGSDTGRIQRGQTPAVKVRIVVKPSFS